MKEELAEKLIKQLLICSKELDAAINLLDEYCTQEEKKRFAKIALKEGPFGAIKHISHMFPLLWPYPTKSPSEEVCRTEGFKFDSPWHRNAYSNFMFRCNQCGIKITKTDTMQGSINKEPEKLSVELTNEALKSGWVHKGKYSFYCARCSENT